MGKIPERVESCSMEDVNKRKDNFTAGTARVVLFLHFGKERHGATGKGIPDDEELHWESQSLRFATC